MISISGAPESILVRSPNWIGDQVLALPFFYYLRQRYPRARIVSACAPWVESIQFRNWVDEVIPLPRLGKKGWLAKWEHLQNGADLLQGKGPWDLAITLPNSFSSAWQLFRAGVRERIGYSADARGFLLNRKGDWKVASALHRGDAYLNLLPAASSSAGLEILPAASFWGVLPANELDPGIPGVLERFDAEVAWPGAEILEPPSQKYWVLAPGSTAESRRWPVERFAALARKITDETGWIGIIVGGVAEAVLAERLAGPKLLDRTARSGVSGLWKVFRDAQFTVANDSGLAHVASLCGSPVQVIWGAGDPKRTKPIGPGPVQIVLNAVECWPCEQNLCKFQGVQGGRRLECLRGIAVEAVWKEIQDGILKRGVGEGRK
jgi:lipopolysaccharide heptosyltransferase II